MCAAVFALGCARSAEERQLDEMRGPRSSSVDEDAGGRRQADTAKSSRRSPKRSDAAATASRSAAARAGARRRRRAAVVGADDGDGDDPNGRPIAPTSAARHPRARRRRDRARATSWQRRRIDESDTAAGAQATRPRPSALDPEAKEAYDAALALVNGQAVRRRRSRRSPRFLVTLARSPVRRERDVLARRVLLRARRLPARRRAVRGRRSRASRSGRKAPDALLKLGMCQQTLGNPQTRARRTSIACAATARAATPRRDSIPEGSRRRIDEHRARRPSGTSVAIALLAADARTSRRVRAGTRRPPPSAAAARRPAGGGRRPTAAAAGGGGTTLRRRDHATYFPGGVAPPPPGGTLGGGNATVSRRRSRSRATSEDRFDFGPAAAARGATVHGDAERLVRPRRAAAPSTVGDAARRSVAHSSDAATRSGASATSTSRTRTSGRGSGRTTRRSRTRTGSTRAISVKLRAAAAAAPQRRARRRSIDGRELIDRRRQVPPETIFLRDQGFIDDDANNWGEINGAPRGQDVPHRLRRGLPPHRRATTTSRSARSSPSSVPSQSVGGGKLDRRSRARCGSTSGTRRTRIARAQIIEALDVIERGARIGPVARRFEVVPPARNEKDVEAHGPHERPPARLLRAEPGRLHRQGRRRRAQGRATASSSSARATPGTRASASGVARPSASRSRDDSPAATENAADRRRLEGAARKSPRRAPRPHTCASTRALPSSRSRRKRSSSATAPSPARDTEAPREKEQKVQEVQEEEFVDETPTLSSSLPDLPDLSVSLLLLSRSVRCGPGRAGLRASLRRRSRTAPTMRWRPQMYACGAPSPRAARSRHSSRTCVCT